MSTEINFYEVDESIIKALAPVLIKIVNEGKKALIYCASETQMQEIDKSLWSYGRSKFIAHVTINDQEFDMLRQSILITNRQVNDNSATHLIFLDEPDKSFVEQFSRAFYFYENQPNIANISPNNSYRKENGKWQKISK